MKIKFMIAPKYPPESTVLSFSNLCDPRIASTLSLPLSGQLVKSQCLVVTGPNGSGKTTFLTMLAMINKPQSGYVEAQPLFYCGHQTGLKPSWTVKQNLDFRLRVYSCSVATSFEEMLTRFKLEKYLRTPLGHLSRGQQQQIALISGLLSPYGLWILDEPFAHLDQHAQTMWQLLMDNHCQEGGALVYSTHTGHKGFLQNKLSLDLSSVT